MISVLKAGRIAALAAALAAFALPAAAQPAREPFRLIITEPTTPVVPNSVMELAEQLGYYDEEGVNVEFIRVSDTTAAAAALIAGEGEMANISVEAALALAAQDQLDFRAVTSPDKFLPFLIAARSTIATPADLAGKSFGVANVGSLDYTLSLRVFQSLGVDPASVNIVAVGAPAQRGTALIAGQIDATTMSIGVFLGLEDKSNLKILVPVDEYQAAAAILNKVNIVPVEVLEERRDEVVAFVRAIIRASRLFNNEPNAWVEAMTQARPDYARENLVTLAEQFRRTWSVNGGMDRPTIELAVEETYKGQALAGLSRVPLEDWVDFTVADDALAQLTVDPSTDPAGR